MRVCVDVLCVVVESELRGARGVERGAAGSERRRRADVIRHQVRRAEDASVRDGGTKRWKLYRAICGVITGVVLSCIRDGKTRRRARRVRVARRSMVVSVVVRARVWMVHQFTDAGVFGCDIPKLCRHRRSVSRHRAPCWIAS